MPTFRKYLLAGLLVWLPLGVTVLVIKALIDLMDRVLVFIPEQYHAKALLGFHIPGTGVLLSLIVLFATGVIAANLFGKRVVMIWESLVARIPLVNTIYSAVKQVAETLFANKGKSFRKVLLIEYPRKGVWAIAFYTGSAVGEIQDKTSKEVVNVFLPTTPNPTSGFLLMVPREDIIELDMPVDDGIKLIMSLGVIVPENKKRELTGETGSKGSESFDPPEAR